VIPRGSFLPSRYDALINRMKVRSVSLPDELDQQAEQAALRDGRTYSSWVRVVLERELAREASKASRRRSNASELISGAATSGQSQLSALQSIATNYQERKL
jgi:hypothetical protein